MSAMSKETATMLHRLGVDRLSFERWLTESLGAPTTLLEVVELGESSRETPWRLDLDSHAAERVVFRFGDGCSANEATALRVMESQSLPAPRLLAWDPSGDALGVPLFLSEYIDGEPLLGALEDGDEWAESLYIETACALQTIRPSDLPLEAEHLTVREGAAEVLEDAYAGFVEPDELIHAAYRRLLETRPDLPEIHFSNGDLWPENLLVRHRRLVAVIDWQHAGFSDPIFEFLLPFFLVPELRGRGIEERYCERMGFDAGMLSWYHGMEFFDSLRWVLKVGKPYEMHTAESLRRDLRHWLSCA